MQSSTSGLIDWELHITTAKKFVTVPPPLSPIFQEGGALAGWNEDVAFVLGALVMLFLLDTLIVKPFMAPKSRYFALHAVTNFVAVFAAAPDVYRVFFENPLNAFSGPSHTMVANSVICALHVYHCLMFNLTPADIFHHAMFVSILCGLALPFKQEGGAMNNLGCFFLSGLPGGLDYVLLCLMYHGIITRKTEKRLNALINQWLRAPSMTIYAVVGWFAWYGGYRTGPWYITWTCILLHFYNGQYYARMAYETYTQYCVREASGVVEKKEQ